MKFWGVYLQWLKMLYNCGDHYLHFNYYYRGWVQSAFTMGPPTSLNLNKVYNCVLSFERTLMGGYTPPFFKTVFYFKRIININLFSGHRCSTPYCMSQLDAINELFPPGKTICTSEFSGHITVKPGQAFPPDCINEFIIQILWWLIKDYTCRFIYAFISA